MSSTPPGKILVITPDLPYPLTYGSRVRIYSFIKALRKRFHVIVFSLLKGEETPSDIEAVRGICDRLVLHRMPNKRGRLPEYYHRFVFEFLHLFTGIPSHRYYYNLHSIQHSLRKTVQEEKLDAILQEYWYTSLHLHEFAPEVLRIADTHDVHFERMELFPPADFLRFKDRDLKCYKAAELSTLQTFNIILAVSEGDQKRLCQHLNKEILVVPTGVDTVLFSTKDRVPPIPNRIGFFGAIGNPSNVDAIFHFYHEIFPRICSVIPSVSLYIIGGCVPPEIQGLEKKDHRIRVTGYVEDLQDELQKLQVAIMPLRMTSGVRGRIYEIMAVQVPIVAYPAAVKGMNLVPGKHYTEATIPSKFAEQVISLLKNPYSVSDIIQNAYLLVNNSYSHQATYDTFCQELEQRIDKKRHSSI